MSLKAVNTGDVHLSGEGKRQASMTSSSRYRELMRVNEQQDITEIMELKADEGLRQRQAGGHACTDAKGRSRARGSGARDEQTYTACVF